MDSKKLARIIELVVKKEVKKQLPLLVKEGVAKALRETKVTKRSKNVEQTQEKDMFSLAESALEKERKQNSTIDTPKKTYTKNPILNDILNETKPFKQGSALDENQNQELHEGFKDMDKTIDMTSNIGAAGTDGLRAQMASKMGYGDMIGSGPQKGGLGVQTGHEALDKAMNRDYSELVKKFKK